MEFSCFLHDPVDAGNLISGSSAFSKTSLNIWKFTFTYCWSPAWRILSITLPVWDECNCVVVWALFGIAFLWDWNENWPFPVLWPLLVFQICWHIEHSTFTASSFRSWNSSTGIPSFPLALFVVMLPKAHLTPECLALGEWSHHHGYLSHEDLFCIVHLCIFPSLLIFSFCEVHTISVLYCAHLSVKCSLGISKFLDEISSLSHSIVFLFFLALITEEAFLISSCCSLEVCIKMGIFPFLLCFNFSSFHSYL